MKLRPADKLIVVWLVLVGGMCVASYSWGFRVIVKWGSESLVVVDNSGGALHVAWSRSRTMVDPVVVHSYDRGGTMLLGRHRNIRSQSWDGLTWMGLRLYRQHPMSLDNPPISRGLIVSHIFLLVLPVVLWLPFQRWRWRRQPVTAPAA